MDLFGQLFDTGDFPARWICGQWTELHGWTHIVSDLAIFGAYTAIPFVLAYFTFRRRDFAYRPLFWLFCAFIFACGTTHLIDATLFWHPWYRLSAVMKVATALVSWGAVIALVKLAPSIARLPGLGQLTAIVSSAEDAIVGKDMQGRITSWNPGAERIYGWTPEEVFGKPIELIVPDERRHELDRIMTELHAGRRVEAFETVRLRKDGALIDVSLTVSPVRDGRGRVVGATALARDITAIKRAEHDLRALTERLERQAQHDPLTGLANRRGLEQELERELGRARRAGSPVVAVLVDLDDFKQVNDRFGHSGGDEIIRGVAERLAASLRPADVLARIGGDEFLVLLPETRLAEGRHVAERLRLSLAGNPMEVDGERVELTASLGVMGVPEGVLSLEQLLDLTRHGLAASKGAGKNRVAVSDASGQVQGDSDDAHDVQALLAPGALSVRAQPVHDLASGEVVGHELLVRGPPGPYHEPHDMFRLSVERNVLASVDLACFATCVEQAAPRLAGRLHVNLFPSTLLDTPVARLTELLANAGGAERFCVELSEQQFLGDPASLREAVDGLRAAGVTVALDDVGFGRSSLEALVVLEPDVVKIDHRFVHGVGRDRGRRRRLERLVRTLASLDCEIVAEGLEEPEDREVLLELGVTRAQGYLLGPPEPLPDDD